VSTAVELIKEKFDKEMGIKLLEHYNVHNITDNGDSIRLCCPLHGGNNTTAFVWNFDNGLWYCHTQCKEGGDVFDFIAKKEEKDIDKEFKEIVVFTANLLGLDISNLEMGKRAEQNKVEVHKWIHYMNDKLKDKTQVQYDLLRLGDLYDINKYRNFSQDTLKAFGVKYSDDFKRIVIPIFDINNRLVGATMRAAVRDAKPKWIHKPDGIFTGNLVFNINNIDCSEGIVTEGAFDVMNLYQNGIYNSVATFGANTTEQQAKLLCMKFFTLNLMYDADKAGILANKKAISMLKNKLTLYVYELPLGTDPGDLTKEDVKNLTRLKYYQYIEKYKDIV